LFVFVEDAARVVWVSKDRTKHSFEQFFDTLGPHRAQSIEAVSLDGNSIYLPVAREHIPQATVCLDPFHVIGWAGEVVDSVYRSEAPDSRPVRDGPTAGSGDAPAMRCAPARNASTSPTTPSWPACAGTATGCGALGS
jgi:transposase